MYSGDMAWQDWTSQLGAKANSAVDSIQRGKELADKFNALIYGRTDAEVILLPQFANRTEADIVAMRYAMGALIELWNAMNNVAVAQVNRMGYLGPFI